MRLLTADYILPIISEPLNNGFLLVYNDGSIAGCFSKQQYDMNIEVKVRNQFIKLQNIEHETHTGIICPGFINTHCHLELSYLKGLIPEKTGLDGFVKYLQKLRNNFSDEQIQSSIEEAESEMINNGIVAVGDICNSNATFYQKSKENLKYHTFIESFGFDPLISEPIFLKAKGLEKEYKKVIGKNSFVSITPHAPYSVSEKLMKKIGESCYPDSGLISMHNQETEDENLLFRNKTGNIAKMLTHFGLDLSKWQSTGYNSLPSVLVNLPKCNNFLLVHNTFTSQDDINWASNYSKSIWWCFCPNANLYIENKMPDLNLFIQSGCKITLGTDSLASNNGLSILEEMKTIQRNFPKISLADIITWGTINGADYLGFTDLGSFEENKKPGVNLITSCNLEEFKLTDSSKLIKLI